MALSHLQRGDPSRSLACGWVKPDKNMVQRADQSQKRMAAVFGTNQSQHTSRACLHGRRHRGLASRVLSCPPLACLFACPPPKTEPPLTHLPTALPPPHDWRFATAVDADHRCRESDKWCGSIGHGPALSPVLLQLRYNIRGCRRRSCGPLAIARPPAIICLAVAARGELSCTVLLGRKSAGTTIACRSLQRHWIAPAREVFDEMGELIIFPFICI
jgi:hypothetical protein